jgi:hypothetical protein
LFRSAVSDAIRSRIFSDWAFAAATNTTSAAAARDAAFRIDLPAAADLKSLHRKRRIRLGGFKSRGGTKLRKVGRNSLDTFIADHSAAIRHRRGGGGWKRPTKRRTQKLVVSLTYRYGGIDMVRKIRPEKSERFIRSHVRHLEASQRDGRGDVPIGLHVWFRAWRKSS